MPSVGRTFRDIRRAFDIGDDPDRTAASPADLNIDVA